MSRRSVTHAVPRTFTQFVTGRDSYKPNDPASRLLFRRVVLCRALGMKFREVGERLGVGSKRARDIFALEYGRFESKAHWSRYFRKPSAAEYRALMVFGGTPTPDGLADYLSCVIGTPGVCP